MISCRDECRRSIRSCCSVRYRSGNSYEVAVHTGTGSGTLGQRVVANSTITNVVVFLWRESILAAKCTRSVVEKASDRCLLHVRHADYRPVWNDGEITFVLHSNSDVIPEAKLLVMKPIPMPIQQPWSIDLRARLMTFTGVAAGTPFYVIPATQVTTLRSWDSMRRTFPPMLSPLSTERSSNHVLVHVSLHQVQMVDMRSSSGGDFSVWSTTAGNPQV